jgi:predicted NBD/HSP70 family sugar kinase
MTQHDARVDGNARADGSDRPLLVGVDVGGSKIAVLVVDRDDRVLAREVAPTKAGAQDRAVEEIAAVVAGALARAGATATDIAALGVGVPGRVDPLTGDVTLAVNLGWSDLPLGSRLEAHFGRPCVVENDVRAAALGLHRRRVLGDIEDLAYLAVGTGVSAGVVLDGRLHRGAHGLAGEIGYLAAGSGADPAASPVGLAAAIAGLGFGRPDGPALDVDAILRVLDLAGAGDAGARAAVRVLGATIARAVAAACAIVDPELVVLGGPVGAHPGLLEPIRATVASSALAPVRIEPGAVTAFAPLRGALVSALDTGRAGLLSLSGTA